VIRLLEIGPRTFVAAAGVVAFVVTVGCGPERSAKKLPIGNVETPKPSETVKGSVRVTGWALSEQGIERVDAYWDDSLAASSKTGGSRPDVRKVYPNYRDAEISGFDFSVDLSGLPPGPHELTVQVRSRDDAVRELYRFQQNVAP
jgi:hypothetical protein